MTAVAAGGVIAKEIGARWGGKQRAGAETAGIELGNPGAFAVTASSLVTMKVKGKPGDMKELAEVFERAKAAA